MTCSICGLCIENGTVICSSCGQKTHETCGEISTSPGTEDGTPTAIFSCFRCKAQALPFMPYGTLVGSTQFSAKEPPLEHASGYPRLQPIVKREGKLIIENFGKLTLLIGYKEFKKDDRKLIMNEFFDVEDKTAANSYSWIAACKLCRQGTGTGRSRQGKLKISKGSTRTIITHLIAYHLEEFKYFQEQNPQLRRQKASVASKASINNLSLLHREIMSWIIHSNQDFAIVEDNYLLNLLSTLQGALPGCSADKGFPKGETFRKDLPSFHAELELEKRKKLSTITSRIALTVDVWTCKSQTAFLGITGHWIDSEFALQNVLLGFIPIQGPLTGGVILQVFTQILAKYGLFDMISSITVDNAALKAAFMNELTLSHALPQSYYSSNENVQVRCLTHVFHLLAQTLVLSYDQVELPPEAPLQYFLAPVTPEDVHPEEGDSTQVSNESPLGIVRRVMCLLRDNATHREIVEKFQHHEGREASTPFTDLRSRWTSTCSMLKWMFEHKQVIVTLMGGNGILANHWQPLEELLEILNELELLTSFVTEQKSVSLTTAFISIETLAQKLESLAVTHGETGKFGSALSSCRLKLQQYLPYFESNLHLIATLLHPRAKVAYFDVIKPNLKERAIAALSEIFNAYNTEPRAPTIKQSSPSPNANDILSSVFDRINSHKLPLQDELNTYLSSTTENVDILTYWRKRQSEYPVLAKVARDIFAIQGNSAASESYFNGGLDFMRWHRTELTPMEYKMYKEAQAMLRQPKAASLS